MYNVLDTLFIWNEDYTDVLPNLVTDYSVSDDGLSYTMTLRDDVYFQDGQYVKGRKMTAEDVKYSLERSKEESPTDRVCRDFFDYVEVLSDTEFVIHMTSPAGPFLNQLAEIGTAIVPREEVEGWGDDFGSHIVGSGPFTLEEVVTDERVVLKKNPNYWGEAPHVDGVEFRIVTDSNQAINAVPVSYTHLDVYKRQHQESTSSVPDALHLRVIARERICGSAAVWPRIFCVLGEKFFRKNKNISKIPAAQNPENVRIIRTFVRCRGMFSPFSGEAARKKVLDNREIVCL